MKAHAAPKPAAKAAGGDHAAKAAGPSRGPPAAGASPQLALGLASASLRSPGPDAESDDGSALVARMERAYRMSFADVTLRTDGAAAARASSLSANAYTDGHEIGFAAGRFAPGTRQGLHTIAHEFAHVAQLHGGTPGSPPVPSRQQPGAALRQPASPEETTEDAAEAQADQAADAVLDGQTPEVGAVTFGLTLADDEAKPPTAPPKGTVRISGTEKQTVLLHFASEDVIAAGDLLLLVFQTYIRLGFEGGTNADAQEFIASVGAPRLDFGEGRIDPIPYARSEAGKRSGIPFEVYADFHATVVAFMATKGIPPKVEFPTGTQPLPDGVGTQTEAGTGAGGGAPDGAPEGVLQFDPVATLETAPAYPTHAAGAELRFRVDFDKNAGADNAAMNVYPGRAFFDWTIKEGDKVIDTGPVLEAMGGYNEYSYTFQDTGTFIVNVVVTSPRFRNPTQLDLTSAPVVVVDVATAERALFDELAVGPDADQPFTRDAEGKLAANADFKPLTIDEQILLRYGYLGAIEAMPNLTASQRKAYTEHYQTEINALEAVRDSVAEKSQYVISGVFRSSDDTMRVPAALYMYDVSPAPEPGFVSRGVLIVDSTNSADAQQHPGVDHVASTGDEKADGKQAEELAIQEALDHIRLYNDYPSGRLLVAIKLKSTGEVFAKGVPTDNLKKTVKAVAGYGAAAAGLILLAASPFTAGGTALVGIVLLEAAAIAGGAVAVGLNLWDRYQTDTLRWDRQTMVDLLQLVTLGLAGAGSVLRVFDVLGKVGTMGFVVTMGGLDIASLAFMERETQAELIAVEAEYAIRIERETDPAMKKQLVDERNAKLAQVLGAAAVSGAFVLISVASGVRQLKGLLTKKTYVVSDRVKQLAETGDLKAIRAELEGPTAAGQGETATNLTPVEREFLLEVARAKEQGVPGFKEVDETSPTPKDEGETARPTEEETPTPKPEETTTPTPHEEPTTTAPKDEGTPGAPKDEGETARPTEEETPTPKPEEETAPVFEEPRVPTKAAVEVADELAATDPKAKAGLERLRNLFTGVDSEGVPKVNRLLSAATDNLADFLRALSDPGFTIAGMSFDHFYLPLTARPDAMAYAQQYGGKILGKLSRRYGWGTRLGEAMKSSAALIEQKGPDPAARSKAIDDLFAKPSTPLDKALGLAAAPIPKPPTVSKKNRGIDRQSIEWAGLRKNVEAQSNANQHGFSSAQLDVWADIRQTVAVARRGGFQNLSRDSGIDLLNAVDKSIDDAGLPSQFKSGLRGDLAEWLFNPGRGLRKPWFKNNAEVESGTKGATIPDYSIDRPNGTKEWVNQKSDLIDQGTLPRKSDGVRPAAEAAANNYRKIADKEAGNVPKGDVYSLDFIRDPGEASTYRMLEILFGAPLPSPVTRVKIGETWYDSIPAQKPTP